MTSPTLPWTTIPPRAAGPHPAVAALGLICCFLAAGHSVPAQDAPASRPERATFEDASGVRIDVSMPRKGATDEEIARALEQAARQVRERATSRTPPAQLARPSADPIREMACIPADPPRLPGCEMGHGPGRDRPQEWTLLPSTLLWEPPLANPLQPRLYVKPTTLDTDNTRGTIDTAIGATAAVARWNPFGLPDHGFQSDVFAVVFSRWSRGNVSTGVDYRFGFPVTLAYGPWESKLAYEHTSTHVGDDFIEQRGRLKQPHVRDEIVLGLAYRLWDRARVYGQFGYAFQMDLPDGRERPVRYNWGVEWSCRQATGFHGQPFAAFDMDLRGDQDYTPNMTAQVGWQWRAADLRPSMRVALELYHGRSPFGQFFRDREKWVGIGAYFDY